MPTSLVHKLFEQVKTLKRVFFNPVYLLTAILAGGSLLLLLSVFPHRTLLWAAVSSPSLSLPEKLEFVQSILVLLGVNMSGASVALSIVVAILFGMQASLLVYYIRRRRSSAKSAAKLQATSLGGVLAALFGIGCAACGSVIATALFGLVGAGGMLLALPLQGLEFGIFGVGLLLLSIMYLLKRVNDPLVCALD